MTPSDEAGYSSPLINTASSVRPSVERSDAGIERSDSFNDLLLLDASQELQALTASHPRTLWLTFSHPPLERAYQEWHRAVFQRDLRMGLLVSTFLYFLVSVTFAAWSRVHSDAVSETFELALEVCMGVTFSLMFAVSFTEYCMSSRPSAW